MGAHTRLLSVLSLLWTVRSGFAGEPCRGFRHLENGRTFFRYKGLYATFTCNPGFRIHGHHTSSCVSGEWVREPPVCVASGCPSPGEVQHSSSVVNEDRSLVVFSCDDGYSLYGSALLYCKGRTWSNPKPVCKESDIMSSIKQKPVLLPSPNVEKNLRAPSNLKDYLQSHYNTASKDAYLQPSLLGDSFPKSHLSGGLLVKPKTAPLQRKPVKKQWLRKTAAHSKLAPGVLEILTRLKQMVTTASVTRPGSVSTLSTMRAPVLTSTGTKFTEYNMDHKNPEPVFFSGPTTADVLLKNKREKKKLLSPTVSATRDPLASHTFGHPFVGPTTLPQTEVSDYFLNTRKTVRTSVPHLNLNVMSVTSTSAYPATTLDVQNEYAQNVPAPTGGIKKMTDSVKITTSSPSDYLLSRFRSLPETKQMPIHLGVRPPVLSVVVNYTKDTKNEETEEPVVKNKKSDKGNERITQVAETSPDKPAFLLQPSLRAVVPFVPPTASRPTPGLPPSSSKPTPNSSMVPSVRSILLGPDDEGLRVQKTSPERARWDLRPLVEALTGATHLEQIQPVTEAADVTHASLLRLTHQQAHTQSTSASVNVQIAKATKADGHKESTEALASFGPKRGYKELHLAKQDPITASPLDSLQRMHTLPTNSHTSQTYVTHSLTFSSTEETLGFEPSPYSQELEASTKAHPSELPIRKWRPVCPYPPLPAHGTFYFRAIVKPAPLQYKHYIQYACYPGYTLANGDVYSYCQQNGTWSGITPACLEDTPCSLNNGGCSQLCTAGPYHQAQCQCKQGFMLLEDLRTCRDVDECAEERHECQQACINTFGSYRCSCRTGFQLNADRKTCRDTSECAESGQPACEWKCVNLSGSHHCICPKGFRRHTDGRHCLDTDECNYSNGGCSHICKNLRGGFKCSCPVSHRISPTNRKKCLAITVK